MLKLKKVQDLHLFDCHSVKGKPAVISFRMRHTRWLERDPPIYSVNSS